MVQPVLMVYVLVIFLVSSAIGSSVVSDQNKTSSYLDAASPSEIQVFPTSHIQAPKESLGTASLSEIQILPTSQLQASNHSTFSQLQASSPTPVPVNASASRNVSAVSTSNVRREIGNFSTQALYASPSAIVINESISASQTMLPFNSSQSMLPFNASQSMLPFNSSQTMIPFNASSMINSSPGYSVVASSSIVVTLEYSYTVAVTIDGNCTILNVIENKKIFFSAVRSKLIEAFGTNTTLTIDENYECGSVKFKYTVNSPTLSLQKFKTSLSKTEDLLQFTVISETYSFKNNTVVNIVDPTAPGKSSVSVTQRVATTVFAPDASSSTQIPLLLPTTGVIKESMATTQSELPSSSSAVFTKPFITTTPKPGPKNLDILYATIFSVVGFVLIVILIVIYMGCRRGRNSQGSKRSYELGRFDQGSTSKVVTNMYGDEPSSVKDPSKASEDDLASPKWDIPKLDFVAADQSSPAAGVDNIGLEKDAVGK